MTTEWTLNDFVLASADTVPSVDADPDSLGMTILATRATKQTLVGMAEYAGRFEAFDPPGAARIIVDGSPNGENVVSILVPDRADLLAVDGWYVWSSFGMSAKAGNAALNPLGCDFLLVAAESEAEGVMQGGATLLPNDYTGTA